MTQGMTARLHAGASNNAAVRYVAAVLGRSQQSVATKWRRECMAVDAGIAPAPRAHGNGWKAEDVETLVREMWARLGAGKTQDTAVKEVAVLMNRTHASVQSKWRCLPFSAAAATEGKAAPEAEEVRAAVASMVGDTPQQRSLWTPERVEEVSRGMAERISAGMTVSAAIREIATAMGRSYRAVEQKWRAYDVASWTPHELEALRAHMTAALAGGAATISEAAERVAPLLGRTHVSVAAQWYRMPHAA